MRKTLIAIIALVSLLAACYAALPWLVSALVLPRMAEQLGLDALGVDMGHPGLNSLEISRLHLEVAPVSLTAGDIQLSYNLQDLRNGRFDSIVAQQLALAVLPPATDRALSSEPAPETAPELKGTISQPPQMQPIVLQDILTRVPADRIVVKQLEIAVPSMDFESRGTLSLDETGLESQLSGVRPEIARNLSASIAMSRQGTLNFSLEDPESEAPSSIRVLAEPEDAQLAVQAAFSLTGYGLELVQTLSGLPAGTGTVSGALNTSLPWPLEDLPDWRTISATGHLKINWSLAEPAIELNSLTTSIELDRGALTLTADGSTKISTQDLSFVGTITGGTFTYRDGLVTSEDARLAMSTETAGWVAQAGVHTVRITPSAPLNVALSGSLKLGHEAGDVQGNLQTTLTGANQAFEGKFAFNGGADASALLNLPGLKLQDYPFQLNGNYTLAGDILEANAILDAGPIVALPFEVEHNLDNARGALTFSHTQTIVEPLLHKLLPGWQEPYDLDDGVIDLQGRLTWDERLTGSFDLQPRTLTAHYDDYTLINAAGALTLTLTDSNLSLLPSTLSIEAIDIGVPVTNVELSIAGSLDKLTVSQATAELLGGRASAKPFDYEIETGRADITLALSDIDLSEVLALEGENVSGSGRLSGTIPVSLRGNALDIEAGAVTASIPGKIMLSPDLTAAVTQPGLDIALKALENFNYEALAVNVNYDSEGNMLLGVRLEGSNPDLENGRPVHFNLNISENIPVLLKSLRLQDNFTKTLERRITR